MNKKFALLASSVAVMALASCSGEEMISRNREDAIRFHATVGSSSSTRGMETNKDNLKWFYATAITRVDGSLSTSLFTDLLFKKGNDGYFVSTPEYMYSPDLELTFYAYSYADKPTQDADKPTQDADKPTQDGTPPSYDEVVEALTGPGEGGKECEITFDEWQQTINNFMPQAQIADQKDLVVASHTGTYAEPEITFNFQHILSEVQVVAKCDSKVHRVMVKGVKYGNIHSKADFRMEYFINKTQDPWAHLTTVYRDYSVIYNTPINLNDKRNYDHHHKGATEGTYYDISKSESTTANTIGYAMFIPQTLNSWGSDTPFWTPSGTGSTTAQYIAVLMKVEILKVDPDGNPVIGSDGQQETTGGLKFPITGQHQVADTDGYGWAYIPIHTDDCSKWDCGKRYVYHLDFTKGVGYNEDGTYIIKGDIEFSASVSEWSGADVYPLGGQPAAPTGK